MSEQIERLEHHAHFLPDFSEIRLRICHIDIIDPYVSGSGIFQPVDAAQQRAFSGTGRADDSDHIPVMNFNIHIFQRNGIRILFFEMFNSDHWCSLLSGSPFRTGVSGRYFS